MPKLSDTMEEGKILKWLVKEGDTISSGDIIAEIETDKADMEYETIDDGVLLKILVSEGETAPVGKLIAVIGEEGEEVDLSAAPAEEPQEAPAEEPATEEIVIEDQPVEMKAEEKEALAPVEAAAAPQPVQAAPQSTNGGGTVKASPVARKLADAAGIDISTVKGSGPDGRVVKRDIEQHLGGAAPATESEYSKPKVEEAPAPAPQPAAAKPAAAPAARGRPASRRCRPPRSRRRRTGHRRTPR